MRIRILYFVQVLMSYMKFFENSLSGGSYKYAAIFVHAMIYLEGQINCKKIEESWQTNVSHQRLSEFLNHGDMNIKELNDNRVKKLFDSAIEINKKEYILFSVDPSKFKKYKGKKTQHTKYASDGKGVYLAHDFVMSSIIVDNVCIPFKKIIYKGKTGDSKARIHLKLANKFERNEVIKNSKLDKIAVFDGEGCNKKVLPYFHKNKSWKGFVTKFPRTRNIMINEKKIHIKKYLENLKPSDFTKYEHGFYHKFKANIPSLPFLEESNFVVIVDKIEDIGKQLLVRVLITNIKDLSIEDFLEIYRKRWKQETYHQIIKDRLGCRTYKFRKLKAIIRFLELGDLAYSFLEHEKIKINLNSVSEARNTIIDDFCLNFSNKFNLPIPKKLAKKVA